MALKPPWIIAIKGSPSGHTVGPASANASLSAIAAVITVHGAAHCILRAVCDGICEINGALSLGKSATMPALRNAQHTIAPPTRAKLAPALNILALETSSAWCSVALWCDGALFDLEEHAGQRHSERLLPMVDTLLVQAGLTIRALDAVAFGEGPGSFTGLRIACGVAQGLAAGAGIVTVGVGTLLAIAEASGGSKVLAALDARMGEVYCAAYRRDSSGWTVVHPPVLCTPDTAPALPEDQWLGAGSAFAVHPEALATRYAGRIAEVKPQLHPRAREIAVLGAKRLLAGQGTPPEDAHPLYLRDRVALTVAERRAQAGVTATEDD